MSRIVKLFKRINDSEITIIVRTINDYISFAKIIVFGIVAIVGWFIYETVTDNSEYAARKQLERAYFSRETADFDKVCAINRKGDACGEAQQAKLALLEASNDISKVSDAGIRCSLLAGHQANRSADNIQLSTVTELPTSRNQIDIPVAQEACTSAVVSYNRIPKFHYLLARVYHAAAKKPADNAIKEAARNYQLAANAGFGPAFRDLGYLYGGGQLTGTADIETAIDWFRKGNKKGLVEPTVALAYYTQYGFGLVKPDPKEAKRLYEWAIAKGSSEAANRLGSMYRYGFLGRPSFKQAAFYYDEAYRLNASSGFLNKTDMAFWWGEVANPDINAESYVLALLEFVDANPKSGRAKFLLGRSYQYGWGVLHSDVEALRYYNEAVGLKSADAALALGNAYRFGLLGFSKDKALAFTKYDIAIGLGSEQGHLEKAEALLDGSFEPKSRANDLIAFDLVKAVVERNPSSPALHLLARMELYGRGTLKDEDSAYQRYLRLWKLRRNAMAAAKLAVIYRDGLGVEKNISEALDYFQKAKNLWNGIGAEGLGHIYLSGHEEIPQSIPLAWENFKLASTLRQANAYPRLANMLIDQLVFAAENGEISFERPQGVDSTQVRRRNENAALKLLEEAVVRHPGNGWIFNRMGYLHERGYIDAPDSDSMIGYYERAAELNDTWAMKQLATIYRELNESQRKDEASLRHLARAAAYGDRTAIGAMLKLHLGMKVVGGIRGFRPSCSEAEKMAVRLLETYSSPPDTDEILGELHNNLDGFVPIEGQYGSIGCAKSIFSIVDVETVKEFRLLLTESLYSKSKQALQFVQKMLTSNDTALKFSAEERKELSEWVKSLIARLP